MIIEAIRKKLWIMGFHGDEENTGVLIQDEG